MEQPVDVLAPAIGACLNCRQLFLVTPGIANCLVCGRPADLTLSFAPAHPEPVEAPEEEPAPADEPAEPLTFPEPLDSPDLIAMISMFLVGVPEGGEELCALLVQAGADPEAAATAVGRLVAVRDLIADLRAQGLKVSVAVEPEEDRTTVLSP